MVNHPDNFLDSIDLAGSDVLKPQIFNRSVINTLVREKITTWLMSSPPHHSSGIMSHCLSTNLKRTMHGRICDCNHNFVSF